jgi:hypothetical protein
VLYISWGDEVRVGEGRAATGDGFSISVVLKPKRRGRGDSRASLDDGNGGGTGGASLPLPPSTGEHPMAAHGAAAPCGAVAAREFCRRRKKEGRAGWAGRGRWPKRGGEGERAGCKNFHGNDLGYQGESGRIDNGLWQILFTIFKQRFGF